MLFTKKCIVSIFLTTFIVFCTSISSYAAAPTFTEGSSTTRAINENTASGRNIGNPISATDTDGDTLVYTLGGTDAASFSIVSTTGQLQTNAALNHEADDTYTVTVSVADGNGDSDTITVTINVNDVNERPVFSTSGRVTLTVVENTASGTNIGAPFQATDPDSGDTVTYSLQRGDKGTFRIDATTGQLQTHGALDYETKSAYSDLAVRATDSAGLSNSVLLTINVTRASEICSVGDVLAAGESCIYYGTDTEFSVNSNGNGQFLFFSSGSRLNITNTQINNVSYTLVAEKLDSGSWEIKTLGATAPPPTTLGNRTQQVRDAIVAAVPGINDANDVTTAHLAAIRSLDLSNQSISVLKTGDFSGLTGLRTLKLGRNQIANISAIGNLTELRTLELQNNSISNISALTKLTKLTALKLNSNRIVDISALTNLTELKTLELSGNQVWELSALAGLTKLTVLKMSTNPRHNVSPHDLSPLRNLTALTELTLSGNYVYNLTPLTGLTRLKTLTLNDNWIFNLTALTGLTALENLNLNSNRIRDISQLAGLTRLKTLRLRNNQILRSPTALESLTSLRTLTLAGNGFSDYTPIRRLQAAIAAIDGHPGLSIDIPIPTVPGNNAPQFTDGASTTRTMTNSTAGANIGAPVAATDANSGDTLTYYLGGTDAAAFRIVRTTGQLKVKGASEATKASYSVTVAVSDGNGGSDTIAVTIIPSNRPPVFINAPSTVRYIRDNAIAGESVGTPVAATDPDTRDTLTYSLSGTDAAAFSIVRTTGQLKTVNALRSTTKSSYSVTVEVSDGNGGRDTIPVTINVRDTRANNAPVFTEGNFITRTIPENTPPGTNIGPPILATDADGDTLIYTLRGRDSASFSLPSSASGQLRTRVPLDYETKSSYTVILGVTDDFIGSDSITITINVTNEPTPAISERTPQVRNAIVAAAGVANADDVTLAHLAAITELDLSYKSISALKTGDFNDLTALTTLKLNNNRTPQNIGIRDISPLANLTTLTELDLGLNTISDLSPLAGLTALTNLDLSGNRPLSDLSPLRNLTALTDLNLNINTISDLTPLAGLTALKELDLTANQIRDISPLANLTSLTGLGLWNNQIRDISPLANLTSLIGLLLHTNQISDVSALEGLTALRNLTLSENPISDYAPLRRLKTAIAAIPGHPGLTLNITIPTVANRNNPVFSEGTSTTRSIAENTPAGTSIGTLVAATDADYDILTYHLGGTDAAAFSIVRTSGRILTKDALDYETKSSYAVTVSVSDGKGGSASISVTINVTDVPNEDTAASTICQVGDVLAAGESCTYSGTDTEFSVSSNGNGQFLFFSSGSRLNIRDTQINNVSYTLVAEKRNSGSWEITELGYTAAPPPTTNVPAVTEITPALSDRTLAVRDAIVAAVPGVSNANDVTAAHLAAITELDLNDKSISGLKASDFNGLTGLTHLDLSGTSITDLLPITGLTSLTFLDLRSNRPLNDLTPLAGLTALTELRLNLNHISDISPLAGLTALTSLNLQANQVRDLTPLTGLTALEGLNLHGNLIRDLRPLTGLTSLKYLTLTFNLITDVSGLEGLTSLRRLTLDSNTILDYAPLRRLQAAIAAIPEHPGLDLDITIPTVSNPNTPVFTDGSTTTRSIAENTAADTAIGTPVAATDADGDTLTYTLSGTDASSFSIVRTSGQLQTKDALDYETQQSYTVTVTASDGKGGSASITVTIDITDVTEIGTPVANDGICRVGNVLAAGESCTYPGTQTAFSVNSSGNGQFLFFSSGSRLNIRNTQINNVSYTLAAEKLNTGAWEIKALGATAPPLTTNVNPPLSDRTPAVRAAIVAAVPGVSNANDVTVAHLAAITRLDLSGRSISALKTGDFNGLTGLTWLNLYNNQVSDISALSNLTSLIWLELSNNQISDISVLSNLTSLRSLALGWNRITNVSALEGLTSLRSLTVIRNPFSDYAPLRRLKAAIDAIPGHPGLTVDPPIPPATQITPAFNTRTQAVQDEVIRQVAGVTDPGYVTVGQIAAITEMFLSNKSISALKTGDFNGFTGLTNLNLSGNRPLSDISPLASLTALTTLNLSVNQISDISALKYLTSLTTLGLLNNQVSNLSPLSDLTSLTTLNLATNGISDISALKNLTGLTHLDLGNNRLSDISVLRNLTSLTTLKLDFNYSIGDLSPLEDLTSLTTLRLQGSTIPDYAPLRRLKAAIALIPGHPGLDLDITIPTVANPNDPLFNDGLNTTRYVVEGTVADTNIGTPVAATDADGDTLTYYLRGTDKDAFSIVSTTGQLQTSAALDYETQPSYTVTVSVSDGKGGSADITVTIKVTNISETGSPVAADGICRVGNTLAPGQSCTYPDTQTEFSIDNNGNGSFLFFSSGSRFNIRDIQINNTPYTLVAEKLNSGSWEIKELGATAARLNKAPTFTDGASTTRSIAENTDSGVNIGTPVAATDADQDTLTYTLGGTDAASFDINSSTGQLLTKARLDASRKSTYTVTINVSDTEDTATITVTINVTGTGTGAPPIVDCEVGTVLAAGESCTYPGTDIEFFVNNDGNGQFLYFSGGRNLNIRNTSYTLVAEKLNSGAWEIKEIGGTPTTPPPANNAPEFNDGTSTTRSVAENTPSGANIGSAIAATDADTDDTLTYTLSGTDAASFTIVSTTGQLQTSTALDYETKQSYAVTVSVDDGNDGSDSIDVTINVTDVDETVPNNAPVFTDGTSTTRSIPENTASSTNIGTAVAATDADNDTLNYTLGGTDAAAFNIVSTSGQLQTSAALDYETKTSYAVSVFVSDSNGGNVSIPVTISVTNVNEKPNFGFSTASRSIRENTPSGINIGTALTATDPDTGDTLTYTLGGTDKDAFSIVSGTGQLQTKTVFDYETPTERSHSVTVTVSDSDGLSDTISVTINVTNVDENVNIPNNPPKFANRSATLSIAENSPANTPIGKGFAAFDIDNRGNPNNDPLVYSLGGTDAGSFTIDSDSSQLQTSAALDFETKKSYSVTVTVTDSRNASDTIPVTINVTDVNEKPSFANSTATFSVEENTPSSTNIGTALTATDPDTGDTLTYTLGGTDASSFGIDSASGQLQTSAALDYEAVPTKTSYSMTVTATDPDGLSATISVTITVTDVDETVPNTAPAFSATSAARSIAENSDSGTNIGDPVTATDADEDDLTYTLGGTDAGSFTIDEDTGQLQVSAALDFETTTSYSVTVSASDGRGGNASIPVNITVTNVNEAPSFAIDTATLSVPETTASGTDIGDAFTATDPDASTTLTFELGGTDASSFTIVSTATSAQLQTNTTFDYEAEPKKISYSVTVTVSDSSLTDSITVIINITDEPEPAIRDRTPAVRDKIVEQAKSVVPLEEKDRINGPDDVTVEDLKLIKIMRLRNESLTTLAAGDFNGLTGLLTLDLSGGRNAQNPQGNQITDISPLAGLTSLTTLYLNDNSITDISALDDLTALTTLYLTNNSITVITALDELTALISLGLGNNSITDISALAALTALTTLNLTNNSISNISHLEDLTALTTLNLKANSVSNISKLAALTALTTLDLRDNSINVIPNINTLTALTTLKVKNNPISSYANLKSLKTATNDKVTIDLNLTNSPPVFKDGEDIITSTTRSVLRTASQLTSIGDPVTATDADGDTLTYKLLDGGELVDSTAKFSIDIIGQRVGQLRTKRNWYDAGTNSYTVTIQVTDNGPNKAYTRITVTIEATEPEPDPPGNAPSVETPPVLPETTALLSNYPNPFNPETWIPYQLAKPAEVTLTIYDIRGRVVRTLRLGHQPAGFYQNRSKAAHWDGRNHLGEKVATGVYFYTLKAGDYTATRKLLIRK